MSVACWKEFDHPADIGIKVWADSYTKLVLESGIAFSELTTDVETIETTEEHHIVVDAKELDLLLVEFLNELLFLLETKDFIATAFKKPNYFADKDRIIFTTIAIGGKWEAGKHESKAEIKAVTYHELEVRMIKADKWAAKIIFDV
jgi:SHS2 domain-containing protein